MLSREAFAQMKDGVRIVNCARGELVDEAALAEAIAVRQSGRTPRWTCFSTEPPPAGYPLFASEAVLATPHIGGSTEEAQEIVGVRIAEQVVEYLKNGVAINAVNMPALSPEQYRALGPYVDAGRAAGQLRGAHRHRQSAHACGCTYFGKIADSNTSLLRNAGLAGVLSRSTVAQGEPGQRHADRRAARLGRGGAPRKAQSCTPIPSASSWRPTAASPAWKARWCWTSRGSLQVDGIYCEAALSRLPDLHEEPGRARRDRPRGHGAGQEPHQHRQLLAGPARRARRARASRWKPWPWSPPTSWCPNRCWRNCAKTPR